MNLAAFLCLACLLASSLRCFAADPGRTSGRFQYSPELSVAYDVEGNGDLPVVLLHGLASSKESYDLLNPELLPHCGCRIYRIDLRGHGDTSAPNDTNYALAENVKIVRAFLNDRHLHNIILAGHSYGGAVALQTALELKETPGSLRALVLISTPAVVQRFPVALAGQRYVRLGSALDRITPATVRAFAVVHGANYHNNEGTRLRQRLYARLWSDPKRTRAARLTAREFLDGGGLTSLAEKSHDTGVPTLVLAGTRDHLVKSHYSEELASTIPNAKLVIFPGVGHALEMDAPETVARAMREFLTVKPSNVQAAPERIGQ